MPNETDSVEVPLAEWETPETAEYGAYWSISVDLQTARALALRILQLPPSERSVRGALLEAALVRYGRCFTTGRRPRLDVAAKLAAHPHKPLDLHNFCIGLRDQLIAHSVSDYEQYKVGLVLAPAGKPREVKGVAVVQMRLIEVDDEHLRQFAALAEFMGAEFVQPRLDALLPTIKGLTADQLDQAYTKSQQPFGEYINQKIEQLS